MALVLIAAIGGIGGFMYMKSNKGKKKADAPDPDADYFDSDDDEDYLADMDIEEEIQEKMIRTRWMKSSIKGMRQS